LDYYQKIPEILLESSNCDGVLAYFLVPSKTVKQSLELMGVAPDQVETETGRLVDGLAQAVSQLPAKHAKPLIGFSFRNRNDLFTRTLQNSGLPVLPDPGRAARAMAALVTYRQLRAKIESSRFSPEKDAP
jgi:acyl-CoA synthetase (NDP forming)